MATTPSEPAPHRTAVFTVVARNYLHFARVLMQSIEAVHPEWDRVVVLADPVDGAFDASQEPFAVVEARELGLPDRERMAFRYTTLEFSTAVKPWCFRRLFDQGYDRVVYLDPDIYVYLPLEAAERELAGGALAVLVPHLTGRIDDDGSPGEHDVLRSGAYNLGFCALARHSELDALLDYWCQKSERDFVVDLQRGLFTDQRWMDLVPGMFADVHILRDEGYDVAYWNMPHRRLDAVDGKVRVNGVPLVFFHFSGLEPLTPGGFSRHQNRYRLTTAGPAAELVTAYVARLREAGLADWSGWSYGYGVLADGTPVPDSLRRLYRAEPEVERWAGPDPLARSSAEWSESVDEAWPPVSRVMLGVYADRPDVRVNWPDVLSADREAFSRWFVEVASVQGIVAPCFVNPIRTALAARPSGTSVRVRREVGASRPRLLAGALRKAIIAVREGRLPMSPRRWLQLYRLHTVEEAGAAVAASRAPLPRLGLEDPAPPMPGLTIVGYFEDGTGVAAAARASAGACAAAGIAHELLDARSLRPHRGQHRTNVLHVNADQIPVVAPRFGDAFFRDRHTIGVWAWELPVWPDEYLPAFGWVNEVWAMSQFVQRAVAERSPVPVLHMPCAVTVDPAPGVGRSDFGLPDDRFLFLVMYDALSVQERKNPLGALAAFRKAFPNPERVGLVIRANHASSRPADVETVRQHIRSTPGSWLVDRPLSRAEAQALQASCDGFVSLHRSEGFGLNIAEAMLLGKPVVATGWSGNMDFTTTDNACLVDYRLVPLTHHHGPYRAGNEWAEPDLDQAAGLLSRLVEDPDFGERIGSRARATMLEHFSPLVVGQRYRRRLLAIGEQRPATP